MKGVNLIPAERRAAQQRRSRLRRWIGLVMGYTCVTLGVCLGTKMTWAPPSSAIGSELSDFQKRITQLNSNLDLTRKQLTEIEQARQTSAAITDQPDWSILLSILSSTLGNDVVLSELHLKPDSTNPAQLMLSIRGVCRTQAGVSQFVMRLQQIKLFDEVKLLRTGREPVQNTPAISFEASCTITSGRSKP